MKIADYNRFNSNECLDRETISLYVSTLIADRVRIASILSFELEIYSGFDQLKDEMIVRLMLHFSEDNPEQLEVLNSILDQLEKTKKLIHLKHKDKLALQLILRTRSMMSKLKVHLKDYLIRRLTELKLIELSDFQHEEVWEFEKAIIDWEANKEDNYIPVLTETISENEYIMLFDSLVEESFSHTLVDDAQNQAGDFIKIPLWHFPKFDGITFRQMKYTLEDLKPALIPFKEQLKTLSEQLFKIDFNPEDTSAIKQMCRKHLSPHIASVQQAIDNSLYISQLRNQSKSDAVIQFCLGITSAENLVNYYEKAEIIQPYVCSETKEQLGRHIDLKAGCVFCYVKFNEN